MSKIFIYYSFTGNGDFVAKNLQKIDKQYKGKDFATTDALFISNINEEIAMHFIEFKNLDYEDTKDLKMSKYWLDKCLKQMKTVKKIVS